MPHSPKNIWLICLVIIHMPIFLISQNVTENFNSGNYNGGTNWGTGNNWIETGDDDDHTSGYIRNQGNELYFDYIYGESIRRVADLSAATTAILTLDWRAIGLDVNEALRIEVSIDGTAFDFLGSITGTTGGYVSVSYDISAYVSATTTIRFRKLNENWESGERVLVDNIVITIAQEDNDGDGILDLIDLDDDNDGIPDVNEYCSSVEAPNLPSSDVGVARTITFSHTDTGYLQFDFMQLDNSFQFTVNGNPIHSKILQFETGVYNPATETFIRTVVGDVIISSPWVVNSNGLPRVRLIISEDGEALLYGTRSSGSTSLELLKTDGLPLNDIPWVPLSVNSFVITNPNGPGPESLVGSLFLSNICDTDGDGVSNRFDLDADNDGIFDLVESGALAVSGANDANNDGIIDGTSPNFGTNGLHNALDDVETTNPVLLYTIKDSDTDGIYDPYELDADNDTCTDVLEAGFTDSNLDGILGGNPVLVGVNGLVTSGTDGYTIPNDLDANSIYDFQEMLIATINTNPVDYNGYLGVDAILSVVVTNVDVYQWQVSINGGVSFTNISNGISYSGVATSVLTVINPMIDKNNYRYRVMIGNYASACISSNSSSALISLLGRQVLTNRNITYRVNQ